MIVEAIGSRLAIGGLVWTTCVAVGANADEVPAIVIVVMNQPYAVTRLTRVGASN